MRDLLREAANPSHAHTPRTLASTRSQLYLPANPHARPTLRHRCYSRCLSLPVFTAHPSSPSAVGLILWARHRCLGRQSQATPSKAWRQEGALRAKLTPEGRAGSG